ncbi:MAG: CAP domain-containing protein [Deltaproteobacteria bacterium]|nr:MAG: CAP domain-containing protein [Deltaproteobacteria bacterium]
MFHRPAEWVFVITLAVFSVLAGYSCGSVEREVLSCESDPECSLRFLPCAGDVCDGRDAGWASDAVISATLDVLGFTAAELWARYGTVGSSGEGGRSPEGYALCGLADVRTDDLGHLSGVRLPETGGLATPVPDRAGRCGTELETLSWRLVNCERLTHALPPADCDLRLVRLSRRHVGDMRQRGYFRHFSPEGFGLIDRLAAAGASYLHAGENLARFPASQDVAERAHQAWMDSDGHRHNVLHESFTHMGVGVVADPTRVLFAQLYLHP